MLALKALVVVLGVMVVAAAGLIVYGILTKFGDLTVGDSTFPERFGDRTVEIPLPAEVRDVVINENHLVIHLTMPDGTVRFLVVDLATGRQLGSIMLEKKAGE